ncbi:50S ribosomal protein L34 [Perilla frutescens var. hirtella]|uniref:50S ribosomal protein L34 n=1 Tax=Perilla frutescens var. hirtella TaxID=608512 RepID=A0AAD4P6V8_PERFH|nr:50S ribosomal protein L34 [Perilla frutescens var. hirtella]
MTALSSSGIIVIENSPIPFSLSKLGSFSFINSSFSHNKRSRPRKVIAATSMASVKPVNSVPDSSVKLLFVEMGVGYDQHGQDITSAAMRACRDAISSNSIPAFRRGSIPGVSFGEMKLQIKLGVPRPLQHLLDIDKVKSVFPYGAITNVEVVDGGLICSSGVHVEEMGDKNDDCYIVNAAVYVGY